MSLIKDRVISLELDESGRINVKTINRVVDTNDTGAVDSISGEVLLDQVISATPHRNVLDPQSGDYQSKLGVLSEQVIGQVAIQQEVAIQARDASKARVDVELADEKRAREISDNDCAKHVKTIAKHVETIASLKAETESIKAKHVKTIALLRSEIKELQDAVPAV